jgi:hypothetical protein
MPKKKAIAVGSLAALGAEKLAEVLAELAASNGEARRRLERLLSVGGSGKSYAAAVRKQIASLLGRNKFYDYYAAGGLTASLDGIRAGVVSDLGSLDPAEAAKLLKELLRAGDRAVECADDSNGDVGAVFRETAANWAEALCRVPNIDPQKLAEELFEVAVGDQYGFAAGATQKAAPALGSNGLKALECLARKALAVSSESKDVDMEEETGRADPFGPGGNASATRAKVYRYQLIGLLRDVADAKGDPDLFIEACGMDGRPETRASDIAERLFDKNRAEEALVWIEKATSHGGWFDERPAWLKIRALEHLGRTGEAQAARWDAFKHGMDERFYVDYVDHARKEERDAVLARAIEEAHRRPDPYRAMTFLTWLREAAALKELTLKRRDAFDGGRYRELTPAADFLAATEPETAALLYRLMVNRVLEKASSKYYAHAARNLRKAESCSRNFRDGQDVVSSHADFLRDVKAKHGRKHSFWRQAEES